MCKFLADLLAAREPLFTLAVKQLEAASGCPSADIRLMCDIKEKVRSKTRELGLDPFDTTGRELYHALLAKIQIHDEHLTKAIGGTVGDAPATLIPLIRKTIEGVKINKSCWVIKKSVAKEMLKKMPPPNIMKRLKHTSIESMLKRENLFEIYGALRFAETPEWLNKFNELYKSLTPADFETRQITFVEMPADRWADIAAPFIHKKRHNITHLKEMGAILMLPVNAKQMKGFTIFVLPLMLHYINEIRLYSAFFKLQQVKPNFGKIVVETLIADPGHHAIMAGSHVHWRVIQRYFGKLEKEHHPEIFEPHVQPEDLHWRKAEHTLYEVDPELSFWRDLDYVAVLHDDRPVTFNLLDIAASYCNGTPYAERAIYHFRESLWNELFMRYMGHKTLEAQVLKQLDNEMVMPEFLTKKPKRKLKLRTV
jgi:hypothetical protein